MGTHGLWVSSYQNYADKCPEQEKQISNSFIFKIQNNASRINEIRHGAFKSLFHPDRLISGPEDAANNFSRGFFTVGKLLLGKINEQSRHLFEQCDMVQGILILRSLGGGTGAGLTSAMFEGLSDYPKTPKIEIPIYPSPTLSTSMVEPYNCLLGEHFCMEDIDIGLLLDNEALFDMSAKFLSINYPTYNTINRMIAQVVSSVTASVRFVNVLNCDLSVLQTNMVPYPRIHFPLCNFAPIMNEERAHHHDLSVQELTRLVFDRNNQMMKVDHFYGKFMSCALFFRGNVCPHHVYSALTEIKRDQSIEFVDWCPTGFKVGINGVSPVIIPDSKFAKTSENVAMLTNTSAIGQAWQRLTHRFYLLYSKRSFVHWFVGEGMEECEFTEALYNISALVKDYEEAAESTVITSVNSDEKEKKPSMDNTTSRATSKETETIASRDDDNDPSAVAMLEKSASNSGWKSPLIWKDFTIQDNANSNMKHVSGMVFTNMVDDFSQMGNNTSNQSNERNSNSSVQLPFADLNENLMQSDPSDMRLSISSKRVSEKDGRKPIDQNSECSNLDEKLDMLKQESKMLIRNFNQKNSSTTQCTNICGSADFNWDSQSNSTNLTLKVHPSLEMKHQSNKRNISMVHDRNFITEFQNCSMNIRKTIPNQGLQDQNFEMHSRLSPGIPNESMYNLFELNSNLSAIETSKDRTCPHYEAVQVASIEEPQIFPPPTIYSIIPSVQKLHESPKNHSSINSELKSNEQSMFESFSLLNSLGRSETLPTNSFVYSAITEADIYSRSECKSLKLSPFQGEHKHPENVLESLNSKYHKTNFSLQLNTQTTNHKSIPSINMLSSNFDTMDFRKNLFFEACDNKSSLKLPQEGSSGCNLDINRKDAPNTILQTRTPKIQCIRTSDSDFTSPHLLYSNANQNYQSQSNTLPNNFQTMSFSQSLVLNPFQDSYSKSESLRNLEQSQLGKISPKHNQISIGNPSIPNAVPETDPSLFEKSKKCDKFNSRKIDNIRHEKLKTIKSKRIVSSKASFRFLNPDHAQQNMASGSTINTSEGTLECTTKSNMTDNSTQFNTSGLGGQFEFPKDNIASLKDQYKLGDNTFGWKTSSVIMPVLNRCSMIQGRNSPLKASEMNRISTIVNKQLSPSLDDEANIMKCSVHHKSSVTVRHLKEEAKGRIKFVPFQSNNCSDSVNFRQSDESMILGKFEASSQDKFAKTNSKKSKSHWKNR